MKKKGVYESVVVTHTHKHTKNSIPKAKKVIGSEIISHIRDESPQSKHMKKVCVKSYKVGVDFANSLELGHLSLETISIISMPK